MRGIAKLLNVVSQDWGVALWAIVGLCFVLAQLFVLRKRYLYIGLLGVGCLATAVRRALGDDPAGWWPLVVQVLGFGNGAVLMVMHSRDNYVRTRRELEAQRARLLREMQELVDRAGQPGATDEGAPPAESSASGATDDAGAPRSEGEDSR